MHEVHSWCFDADAFNFGFSVLFQNIEQAVFFFVLLISVWDEFASFMVQRLPDLASGRLPSRTLCHCWAIACQWAFTDARIRRMLCCVQITSEQTEELCLCVRLCVVKWGAQQKKVGAVDIFFYCFLFFAVFSHVFSTNAAWSSNLVLQCWSACVIEVICSAFSNSTSLGAVGWPLSRSTSVATTVIVACVVTFFVRTRTGFLERQCLLIASVIYW